jgi:methionine-S-sulfoxide reductase
MKRRPGLIFAAFALLMIFAFTGEVNANEVEVDPMNTNLKKATFAGGCFWCMEPPFDKLEGVVSTTSGYTGGLEENPTYKEVSSGKTGHTEAVEILYDPGKVSYRKLLEVLWMQINPTTPDRQFVDVGSQYRAAIFYHNDEQRRMAEESKKEIAESGRFDGPIVTEIVQAGPFWPAEDYHQDYYTKNPLRYKFYRYGSGRDQYLEKVWGKESKK